MRTVKVLRAGEPEEHGGRGGEGGFPREGREGLPEAQTFDSDVNSSGVGPVMAATPAQETPCREITPWRNPCSVWPELGATGKTELKKQGAGGRA